MIKFVCENIKPFLKGDFKMKKLLVFLLAFSLLFVFTACNNQGGTITEEPETQVDEAFYSKPEEYSAVLLVTINPQFNLYLNAENQVLAIEPVNDDAKAIIKDIKPSKEISTVVESIVNKANDGGFVKENAAVNFEIVEITNKEIKTENILSAAKSTADTAFKNIGITAEIKISVAENALNASENNLNTSETGNVESLESTTQHIHSFSAATCTAPQTCSCGATKGKKAAHKFANGKCSVCKAKDPNYKTATYTSVKTKACKWKFMFVSSKGTLYDGSLILNQTVPTIGATLGDKIEPDMPEAQDAITFEGNLYYCGRGTGSVPLKSVTENGTTITVTDTANRKLVLTRIDENTLKVVSSVNGFGDAEGWTAIEGIPKGLILKAK